MPTLSERASQLESDARDAKFSLNAVTVQVGELALFQADARTNLAQLEVAVAVLKQRIDENLKRFERSEVSVETLLKDVAALKTSNDSLLKRHEAWDNRFWGLAVAMVLTLLSTLGSLVTVIATVALRK